ncbi:hypothetical protein MTBUT4_420031 [Magnetospirillum sp. UT-4]|nr:hypothetical protein MTBUT4_420031 [Magnetospirillum sp. UT-4]
MPKAAPHRTERDRIPALIQAAKAHEDKLNKACLALVAQPDFDREAFAEVAYFHLTESYHLIKEALGQARHACERGK